MKRQLPFLLVPLLAATVFGEEPVPSATGDQPRKFRAKEVFQPKGAILYQSDFAPRAFDLLNISEDDRYARPAADPKRLVLKDGPGLVPPSKVAWFTVPRAPDSFRSELSLPHEDGFHERWYALSLYVPGNWQADPSPASDIVIQWHGIPGNWRATYPNLDIAISREHWWVHQSFGDARDKPTRTKTELKASFTPGSWSNWIIAAKWSPGDDGQIRIWRSDELVFERRGPNVYRDIGVQYTPYLKTGIYHPEWHLDTEEKKRDFEAEKTPVSGKEIAVAKIVVGNELATFEEMKKMLPAIPGGKSSSAPSK